MHFNGILCGSNLRVSGCIVLAGARAVAVQDFDVAVLFRCRRSGVVDGADAGTESRAVESMRRETDDGDW